MPPMTVERTYKFGETFRQLEYSDVIICVLRMDMDMSTELKTRVEGKAKEGSWSLHTASVTGGSESAPSSCLGIDIWEK